jgi:hypothetical protein
MVSTDGSSRNTAQNSAETLVSKITEPETWEKKVRIKIMPSCCFRDHPFKTTAFLRSGGVKNWPNLPMDSTSSKNCRRRWVGVKNRENLPTSLMDGPLCYH